MPERAALAADEQLDARAEHARPAPAAPNIDHDAGLLAPPPVAPRASWQGHRGMGPGHLLAMQRTAGNRAVLAALQRQSGGGAGAPAKAEEKEGAGSNGFTSGSGIGGAIGTLLGGGVGQTIGSAVGGALGGAEDGSGGGVVGGVASAARAEEASGPSAVGSGIGGAIGTLVGGGVGGSIGSAVGGALGAVAHEAGSGGLAGTLDAGAGGAGAGGEAGAGEAAGGVSHGVGEAAGEAAGGAEGGVSHGVGEAAGEAAGGAAHGVGQAAGGAAHGVGAAAGGVSHGVGGVGAGAGPAHGGGGAPAAEHGAGGGEPLPDATEPAAPAAGPLGRLLSPGETPPGEPETEEAGEPETEAAPEGELSHHAEEVDSAGRDTGGGGGIVDAIIERAKSAFRRVAGSVGGAARSVIGSVQGVVRNAVSGARSLARRVVSGAISFARSIGRGVMNGIRSVTSTITSGARRVVQSIAGAIRGVMGAVRGAISAAVQRALRGEPLIPNLLAPFQRAFDRIFGGIPGQIAGLVQRLTRAANGLVDRLIGGITSLARRIAEGIGRLSQRLQSAVSRAATFLSGLVGRASALVSGIPSLLRSAVGWLVNRLLGAVRRAIRAAEAAVNRIIGRIASRLSAWVQVRAGRIAAKIQRIRALVTRIVGTVASLVRAGLARLAAFRAWLLGMARAAIGRLLRRVLEPLQRALMSLVLRLIGPQLAAAVTNAKAMFPNGMPTPPSVTEAQAKAAGAVGGRDEGSILAGLTHPEGDHFSYSIMLSDDTSAVAGLQGGLSATFEVVMDYRRNDIGFFVAPGGALQVNIGDIGETGSLSGTYSWGTVGSFGDTSKDVLQGWGGWFTNVSYGVQGGLAVEGGAAIASGGTVSVGGSSDLGPAFSYTPIGADLHPVPGAVTPGTLTGGTPAGNDVLALGEVLFPRQSADVGAAPGGQAAIEGAARTARDYPGTHPGWQVTSIEVLGETSRVWLRPRSGETRASSNRELAQQRANNVKARLAPLVPGLSVGAVGNGDGRPASQGKAENDASPEDQRASMTAVVYSPPTPETRGPSTQGPTTMQPQPFDVNVGLPNPFAAGRSAWGWDTTLGGSALVGGGGKAGLYGGLGFSYSFPVGKARFSPTTMAIIRVVLGLAKVLGDLATLSFLGAIRDAIGLGWGVEALVTSTFTSAIGDWTIPLPPGVAVA